jgi:putative hydrolase of the HAD superfamily
VIKTIIFDLGGVIVPFDFGLAYKRLHELTGLDVEEVRRRISATDLPERLESGRIKPEAFAQDLTSLLDLQMDYKAFCDLFSCIFYCRETIVPESLIRRLKENYRLLLLSNTNAIHFDMLRENYPLLRHFDRWILSFEVGAMKPEARIYQEAIRHSGCEPGNCFFTDDVPQYVEGARREGIDAVQFRSVEQLESDLRSRGVQV